MSFKGNIRKILVVSVWIIGAGMVLVLLVAAINRKNSRTCKSYSIEINKGGRHLFVDNRDIINLITENGKEKITGKTIVSFDLHSMEDKLRSSVWIRDAQVFFDNNSVLQVRIRERQPIARIFTNTGNSFFIDSNAVQMAISGKHAVRLMVFTGYPSEKFRLTGSDSSLSSQVRTLASFISQDPFWSAAIEQVSITPARTFQLVPVIGNHIVEFGDGNNYVDKFHRLHVFYENISAKAGFDKYAVLDVQYEGQVVGTRRGGMISKSDSMLAVRNIRGLIRTAQQMQADTVRQQSVKPLEHNTITEQTLTNYDLITDKEDSAGKR
jgi:cell division protein FtsQ